MKSITRNLQYIQKLQYYMTASIFGKDEVVARSGRKMRVATLLLFELIHITVDNTLNQWNNV